jgi:hypothetical protein
MMWAKIALAQFLIQRQGGVRSEVRAPKLSLRLLGRPIAGAGPESGASAWLCSVANLLGGEISTGDPGSFQPELTVSTCTPQHHERRPPVKSVVDAFAQP